MSRVRPSTRLRPLLAAALSAILGLLLLGAASEQGAEPTSGVDPARVPAVARESLPLITELASRQCPELPPVWVVAQVQAESGWDPAAVSGDGDTAAAGLYQFDERGWRAAGGQAWPGGRPEGDVVSAQAHLRVAVPWMCAILRAVTGHLAATGKPADPLDAMLVCHIAGCARVSGSASGVPQPGEAGCAQRCASLVARYVDAVHGHVENYAAEPVGPEPETADRAPPPSRPDPAAVPPAWTGGPTGCEQPDPTGDGCLTGATRHGLETAAATFGGWSDGPVIRTTGCWDAHAWNPRSDHPRGKACDLFPGEPGAFAGGAELDAGWQVADWFRRHAEPLKVKYLIWQGRYWDPGVGAPDAGSSDAGWGRRYTGGGVYNTRNATGGHYDHVHVSFKE